VSAPNIVSEEQKKLTEALASDLVQSAGWEAVALKQIRAIIRGNHRLLLRRDTAPEDTAAARGAIDAAMTLLAVVYSEAGAELPQEFKSYFE